MPSLFYFHKNNIPFTLPYISSHRSICRPCVQKERLLQKLESCKPLKQSCKMFIVSNGFC